MSSRNRGPFMRAIDQLIWTSKAWFSWLTALLKAWSSWLTALTRERDGQRRLLEHLSTRPSSIDELRLDENREE